MIIIKQKTNTKSHHYFYFNKLEYFKFRFQKLDRPWRKCESPPSLNISVSPSGNALCVVAPLDCFMKEYQSGEKKIKSLNC